ncbi:MAG: patatin-like phospholipase family protein [Clostridiales bacterium]|nr:patatin-like phospholipase family protein [Clostridiales bacterium]
MIDLINNPDILQTTGEIRRKAAAGQYLVSDIVLRDGGQEYQFVDLVLEGGGTLGIALVGYIHALEQAGIRFLGIGGSSVGAIVSLLAYSCGSRTEAKGEKLAAIVGDMNLGSMVDGKFFPRKLSNLLGKKDARLRTLRLVASTVLSLPQIFFRLGLNPGDKLYEWISDRLKENGIQSMADLDVLTGALPKGLCNRKTGKPITNYDTSLKLVAADITTSTKVTFPDMAPMYWSDPDKVNPAGFVRASASIPVFFQPYTVNGISDLIGNSDKWERLGGFTGKLSDKVSFADGGLLSNFPIDLFKRLGIPRAPTFGARLGSKYRTAKGIEKIGQYAGNLFNSMRHCTDYDFIFKNPLYNSLIAHIPTDKYNWLDFAMSPEDKLGLFREGVQSGYAFLECFNWEQYKALRAAELEMYRVQKVK